MAEQKFGGEFNSRLFAEQLLFMDDVRDHQVDFLKTRLTVEKIIAFFANRIRELPLA
jgi:hypothetical protein